MANLAEKIDIFDTEIVSSEEMALQGEDLGSYIAKEYSDHRNSEGFRHDILTMVSNNRYTAVKAEISAFQEIKSKQMPFFKIKTTRYFQYIAQLIEAIEEHKNIPDFERLPAGQQKKVHEQVFMYFDELNNTLKRVEKVIHDLKVQDVRSTIWLLKSVSFSAFLILAACAFAEAKDYLGNPILILLRHLETMFF